MAMKIRSIATKGIGRRIRVLRQARGWTEEDLSKRVSFILGRDFQQYLVSRVEIEFRQGMKEEELLAFAQALEVSHIDLVDTTKPMPIMV